MLTVRPTTQRGGVGGQLLAQLAQPDKSFGPQDMKGQVWLLNVWASWCVACRQEHPLLVELAKRKAVRQLLLPDSAALPSNEEIEEALAEEFDHFGARLDSPEAKEAMTAFFEKRKPDFSRF